MADSNKPGLNESFSSDDSVQIFSSDTVFDLDETVVISSDDCCHSKTQNIERAKEPGIMNIMQFITLTYFLRFSVLKRRWMLKRVQVEIIIIGNKIL